MMQEWKEDGVFEITKQDCLTNQELLGKMDSSPICSLKTFTG